MKAKWLIFLSAGATAMSIALTTFVPSQALATTRYVAQTNSECTSVCNSVTDNPCLCYTGVQEAINAADTATSDSVVIYPGTYTGNFTLNKSVSIYGTETARVLLYGSGSIPTITVDSITSTAVSIKKISFRTSATGISVRNSTSSVEIKNNIFWVGTGGTGIVAQSSPSTRIINNTFYQNGTAVSRDAVAVEITNNIFSGNTTNIAQGSLTTEDNISYNCFHPTASEPNGINFIPDTVHPDPDPDFVKATDGDFHLQSSSPCIDTGSSSILDPTFYPNTRSDIGAYGGPDTDTIPFSISGLKVSSKTDTSVTVSWSSNNCYLVTGYNVYYDSDQSGPPYAGSDSDDGAGTDLPSPIDAGNVITYTISNLNPSAAAPGTPTNLTSEPATERLKLKWNTVDGATGYYVYSDPDICSDTCTVTPTTKKADVSTNLYDLDGLINPNPNPNCYCVTVSAYDQATYFIAVKAYYVTADSSKESLAYSNEESPGIGPVFEGSKYSPALNDFPEAIGPYPPLPNQGCFIATAAYGYYSAPQVMALREFRDRYLVTNGPGRAFVRWYYRVSPPAAQFITEHPSLKPVVRVALAPAVGTARFLTGTSSAVKLLVFMMMLSLALYVRRKRINRLTWEGTEQ